MELDDVAFWAGQGFGFLALALCIAAFSCRVDDRLMVILIFANCSFAIQYLLFGSFVAASLVGLVLIRIVLARRFKGSLTVLGAMIATNLMVAAIVWQGPLDLLALTAALLGTVGMISLSGIPMRIVLAGAALCWLCLNLALGSIGAALAEALAFCANLVTIARLKREKGVPQEAQRWAT